MSLRVGFICPNWPPRFGGAEQYEHRTAKALIARGMDVRVFTATPPSPDFDNGDIEAERLTEYGAIQTGAWAGIDPNNRKTVSEFTAHLEFMRAAVAWAKRTERQIVLIGSPFNLVRNAHARELFAALQGMGIKAGIFHHDLPVDVGVFVMKAYLASKRNWEATGRFVETHFRRILNETKSLEGFHLIGSPLLLGPDFIVACSDWSVRFIDPFDQVPKFILNPLIDIAFLTETLPPAERLPPSDILMVNPQTRKGPQVMRDLIAQGDAHWRFRVLKGGWGNAFEQFIPQLAGLAAYEGGRVDLVDYVRDIRKAYQATRLVFFPSYEEGYGMTAVEPMFTGAVTVSSNFPAILEAVGDAALTLCPYFDSMKQWTAAVRTALENHAVWSEKSLKRAEFLRQRQARQIADLCAFLPALV